MPIQVSSLRISQSPACPCGSGAPYAACCGPLHEGSAVAGTAGALMRSRYAAYVRGLDGYLLATWHPGTRPPAVELDAATRWLGLTVKAERADGSDRATVEFVARWREGGAPARRMHERSRFVREHDRWWYVDGEMLA